jgi:4-amino-4-deoxy-L-arabinose transferase-like glycosyltransferase
VRARAISALLIAAWLAATAWVRPLMLPDEGRYVGVAWEMLRSGDWLTPTLDGLPYFHKPPLFYWITAASLGLFGPNEGAARLAPLIGATAGAWALFVFTQRWQGRHAAAAALLALLAQPLWLVGGQFANLDMLVAGCISASILSLAHAALCIERGLPCRSALAGAYLSAALAVLAKGLIGVVLPALVMVAWLLAQQRGRTLLSLIWAPGVVLFLLVAAPWFIAMQWRFDGFAGYFFGEQHLRRFAEGGFNNRQPFWFFPAVLLLFTLPWWPWLHRLWRRTAPGDPQGGSIRLLMGLWLIVVVLFFSMPQSKLLGYVLPGVPPLAWLIADAYLSIAHPSLWQRRMWWAGAAGASLLSIAAVIGFAWHDPKSTRALAAVLKAHRLPHEPVFMLGQYYFDLPFYARLRDSIVVIDDWGSPHVSQSDNWRKELADAGRFATAAASQRLLRPEDFAAALCAAHRAWVLAPTSTAEPPSLLAHAIAIAHTPRTTLWLIHPAAARNATALGCAETPNGG